MFYLAPYYAQHVFSMFFVDQNAPEKHILFTLVGHVVTVNLAERLRKHGNAVPLHSHRLALDTRNYRASSIYAPRCCPQ
jgi:hypothetical protein